MREDVEAVLAANREFYRAFAARDAVAMAELWSQRYPVACIHPGWDALVDRDQVIRSWQQILANRDAPEIECLNVTPYVIGEAAFVVCHEAIDGNMLATTNIFRLEDGDWKLIHHQSGPLAVLPAADLEAPSSERLH
jgi:ketosteroid isomerase-like protein